MFRFLFYFVISFIVWHYVRKIFIKNKSETFERNDREKLRKGKSEGIDYNDIEDADYEDLGKK